MKINSIHVCFEIADYLKSINFYTTLFESAGFKFGFGDQKTYGSFTNGNFTVFIGESQPRRVIRQPPSGTEFVVTDHVGFSVDSRNDVNSITQAMEKAGYKPLFEAKEYPEFGGDFYAVTFCDTNNNVIEFCHRGT